MEGTGTAGGDDAGAVGGLQIGVTSWQAAGQAAMRREIWSGLEMPQPPEPQRYPRQALHVHPSSE